MGSLVLSHHSFSSIPLTPLGSLPPLSLSLPLSLSPFLPSLSLSGGGGHKMVQRLGSLSSYPGVLLCPHRAWVTGGVSPIGRLTGYTAMVGLRPPLCPAGHCFTSGAKVCSAELANLKANPLGKWKSPPLYGVKSISMWESAPLVLWFSIESGCVHLNGVAESKVTSLCGRCCSYGYYPLIRGSNQP